MDYHDPVLLQASIAGLEIIPDGIYVDVTFGGGGHSKELLKRLNKNGRLFAFDQDEDAKKNNLLDDRFVLIQGNFKFIKRFLRVYGVTKVNGILADLGVSSHQFDVPERGFSTRFDALLDMRMDSKSELSAYEVVNTYTEAKLKAILLEYGELNNAKAIAQAIVKARQETPIKTSFQL
ncbi:MAG: 16S rRNA (cytosine(1402)-N(4))-methyltransferase RsmH, partial [Zetaproteobacteria bacterium]|nr:16S rRNA (cytosine(1402)-N(4))-methyltransferase RsmH [Zetaproteobacteria bacterium]